MAIRSQHPIHAISLCSGAGGLDLGVRLAAPFVFARPCQAAAYVEREAHCVACLIKAMENEPLAVAPIWDDIKSFDGAAWRGAVDLVFGGIPCQSASTAGKRKGDKDVRWLWPHALRIVGEVQPATCFFENVPGLLAGSLLAPFVRDVARPLQEMGYRLAGGLFTAQEVGCTQKRERFFLLAYRDPAQGGRQEAQQGAQRRAPPTRHGRAVGRNNNAGRPQPGGSRAAGEGHPAPQSPGNTVGHPRSPVDSAAGARRPHRQDASAGAGHAAKKKSRGVRPQRAGAGLPLFPPAPRDGQGWQAALTQAPYLAPALPPLALWGTALQVDGEGDTPGDLAGEQGLPQSLLRALADGLAQRTGQLHALGNGVVPLQAAYALCALWAALQPRAR